MLVLGIILLLVAAALLVAALFGGSSTGEPTGFDLGAINVETNTFSVFLLGAVTVALVVAGLALISAGLRRARRRRQDKKELNRLTRKVEAQESRPAAEPAGTTTTGDTTTTETTAVDETTDSNLTDPDHRDR